jgi:ribokinase
MKGYGDCIKELKPELIDMTILEKADIVAIQMKMPQETVKFVIEYCKQNNKPLVIDPTPPEKANILMEEGAKLLGDAAYLTPNEEEAFALIKYGEGKDITQIKKEFKETPKEVRLQMIQDFVAKHPNVIATIGGDGVIYHNGKGAIRKRTFPTECKDSTGAGDTFNGAFIASLARGEGLDRAVEYGLMASSIKVRYEGAQNGVPTYEEVTKALDTYERKNRTHED